jgi:hypothetical protein
VRSSWDARLITPPPREEMEQIQGLHTDHGKP